jgi:HlyD family secretion protein
VRVVTLSADVGDRVAQGQVLVQLDADELQADVAGARAAWDSARQAHEAAARALERAQVLRQQAQADGERAEQLSVLSADALAPTELDARRAAARTSALDVQAAQAQLQATEAAQVQARAAWQAASARLAEASLRAPLPGW